MELYQEALARFAQVYQRAAATGMPEPNAMNVATVAADGRPSSRIVLLKAHDERGFVFYTNTLSRKGEELAGNDSAALCFFWHSLHEQVRIEGRVKPVSDAEADAYFATRARDSQVGAWASRQSQPLASREELESQVAAVSERYPGEVPRPPHWSGYRVVPERIEFWVGIDFRLHERTLYWLQHGAWHKGLLNP
jgi:pyridoxamine 5'-phosphate oxidase